MSILGKTKARNDNNGIDDRPQGSPVERELPEPLRRFDTFDRRKLAEEVVNYWDKQPGATVEGAYELTHQLRLQHAREAHRADAEATKFADRMTAHMYCAIPGCRKLNTGIATMLCRDCQRVAVEIAAQAAADARLKGGRPRREVVLEYMLDRPTSDLWNGLNLREVTR